MTSPVLSTKGHRMAQQETQSDRVLLRTGAASAVLGVVAALVQTGIDPSYPDDPSEAIKQASQSHFLTSCRVLDMSAFLLLLVGLVVITRVFSAARGGPWAAVARALFTVSAAAGAIATMIVGSLPDVAHAWGETTPALKPGYIAAYDALGHVSGGVFAVSWTSLGLFGIVYGVALWQSDLFPRRLAWISFASGLALVSAVVLGIAFQVPVAFVLLVLGLLLSYVVVGASAFRVWRFAGAARPTPGPSTAQRLDQRVETAGATASR
jgi:hypothetical protein